MANNMAADFLREFLNRIFSKSPLFFKVAQFISALLAFAGFVPRILAKYFNIEIPDHTEELCKDIGIFFTGAFGAVLLPVKQVPVAQTPEGEAIKVTDEKKMPFTAKAETRVMEEAVPPPPVKDVPEEPKDTDTGIETKEINSGMWVAWAKDKPGVVSSGSTEKEAYEKAKAVATGTISDHK
jgi:hypothetical protein